MTNILIALVVILTIAALVQLVRVNELLSEITDKDTKESIIIVATKSEADELHEVFAEQGYRFGYDKRIK